MLSRAGQRSASVNCGSDGWTQLDPTFACFNSCLSHPPEGPARVSSNYTGGRVEGTRVEYTCQAGFYDPGSASPPTSVTSICEGGRWTRDKLPYCGGKWDHALRAWLYVKGIINEWIYSYIMYILLVGIYDVS
ncbi:uncharacterized protein LOC125027401 [Penaeus chinensis]|uniref:uncharacterized protein LOC125027401 n=1 Tax=Penaeus chinensis TaxID=139456 RepID=UPI001FB7F373|nr:uncharacterized protein LOC125027401 [Penaeus chinensis]